MALLVVGTYMESRCMCGFGQVWNFDDESVDTQERHEKSCEAVARWFRDNPRGFPKWEPIPHISVYGAHRDEVIRH